MLSNFIKSLIVFTLTGLHHDIPAYFLQLHTAPAGKSITLAQAFSATSFFILQPLAIAGEALGRRNWRSWKGRCPSRMGQRSEGAKVAGHGAADDRLRLDMVVAVSHRALLRRRADQGGSVSSSNGAEGEVQSVRRHYLRTMVVLIGSYFVLGFGPYISRSVYTIQAGTQCSLEV
jgi:hypothetical protein